jgi:dTDP-4-dehydrorhamnose reductase
MNPRLAWVTGAGGLIGSSLLQTARPHAAGWRVRGLVRSRLDLTDYKAVREAFASDRPELIIHCAAISRSPDCEADPIRARRVNIDVTAVLAELAAAIPFVFLSTDLVFDGQKGGYVETDAPNPLGVYAETKVLAEQVVLRHPRHTVVRTSLNGGTSPTGDRGFNEQMRLAWKAGRTLRLFTDEYRSPLAARVTAQAVWELVARDQPGLYHLAGRERLSRWQIGQLVAARWPRLNPRLEPASLQHYSGAPRAPDTSLNCARAQALLSFPLPGLADWLASHPEEDF